MQNAEMETLERAVVGWHLQLRARQKATFDLVVAFVKHLPAHQR